MTSYRPKFTTSVSAAEEAREAFDEKLEEEGRQRVTSSGFGRATRVDAPKTPAPNVKPVRQIAPESGPVKMNYSPLGRPSPAQVQQHRLDEINRRKAANS